MIASVASIASVAQVPRDGWVGMPHAMARAGIHDRTIVVASEPSKPMRDWRRVGRRMADGVLQPLYHAVRVNQFQLS
jgi:hypothetical protein